VSKDIIEISDWVFGSGPSNAKLMLVGEALGKNEEERRLPFVGPAGELVTELLEVAGVKRSSVYITNVVKIRPPYNDLEALHLIHNPETGLGYTVEDFLPLLWNEIEVLEPNCILALGSLACKTLTGKEGIKNWRGSILPCHYTSIKTIPTIHPAALFERARGRASSQGMFTWKQKCHIQFDFIKAVRESQSPSWDSLPKRDLEIIRSSLQLERFFSTYKDFPIVYVDTEVYKAHLVCIGFAFTRYHGVSVPLIDIQSDLNYKGIPLHELTELWRIVAEKLADPNLKKSGQNFKADKVYWLENAGFEVNGFWEDGMFKFHTLSPELPKSLAFQASILTNEPFWKFEGKEYNPLKDNIDTLLRYNARDCVVNCECVEVMNEDLKEFGLEQFFREFVMDLYPIYEEIEKKGWLIDKNKQQELSKFYEDLLAKEDQHHIELCKELDLEPGWYDLNYDSPKQVAEFLYVRLRLPDRKDTADVTLTALMNNAIKNSTKKALIKCVLDRRSIGKIKTVYVEAKIDYDRRMRYTYNQVGTETGRTSTSIIKKPLRNGKWGVPIQTIPRPDEFGGRIREMYIADPGKILIEFDQSQAEARIVALLANDLDLLALFDLTDVHKLTASFLYSLTPRSGQDLIKSAIAGEKFDFLDQVDDFQRQIGKNSRHGLGYALGEEGLSIKMKISLYRAKIAFQKVHEMSPNIKGVFHEDIQQALAENNKVFFTPFGRRREFFEKWGNELFREAYSHIPQSTVGDNTKRAMKGISCIDWIEILAEMHDSIVMQIPENKIEECYHIVKPVFEQSIDFEKCTLKRESIVIPVNAKCGYSWGNMSKVEFK